MVPFSNTSVTSEKSCGRGPTTFVLIRKDHWIANGPFFHVKTETSHSPHLRFIRPRGIDRSEIEPRPTAPKSGTQLMELLCNNCSSDKYNCLEIYLILHKESKRFPRSKTLFWNWIAKQSNLNLLHCPCHFLRIHFHVQWIHQLLRVSHPLVH